MATTHNDFNTCGIWVLDVPVALPIDGLTSEEMIRLALAVQRSLESEVAMLEDTEFRYGCDEDEMRERLVEAAHRDAKSIRERIIANRKPAQ